MKGLLLYADGIIALHAFLSSVNLLKLTFKTFFLNSVSVKQFGSGERKIENLLAHAYESGNIKVTNASAARGLRHFLF